MLDRGTLKAKNALLLAIALMGLHGTSARGDLWEGVATGLGAAGFDIRGGHNVLSGGTDILVTNTFFGETFDFGALELTLNGPISLDFSTGDRILHDLDIALTTAASSEQNATPLSYELTYDVGGQQTSITGTLLVDGAISVNRFGWYEVGLDYSSRQTVVNDGRFDTGTSDFDLDVGPINVRGNIFADMLAAVTDPFFDAAGIPNLFASFSGRVQLQQVIDNQLKTAVAGLGVDPAAPIDNAGLRSPFDDLYGPDSAHINPDEVVARSSPQAILTSFDQTPGAEQPRNVGAVPSGPSGSTTVVPEPSVLLLMLLGVPALLTRRRRIASR